MTTFWHPDIKHFSLAFIGFEIILWKIPDSTGAWIPDSTGDWIPDSRKQKDVGFRIPDSYRWGDTLELTDV